MIAVTGLLVFSCYSHPGVRKRKAVFWIVLPLVLLAGGIATIFYRESHSTAFDSPIAVNQLELFDLSMNVGTYCGEITGRVRNLSSKELTSMKLRVQLSDPAGVIDGGTADVTVEVPSAETRSFTTTLCDLRPKPNWTWSYSVLEAKGR